MIPKKPEKKHFFVQVFDNTSLLLLPEKKPEKRTWTTTTKNHHPCKQPENQKPGIFLWIDSWLEYFLCKILVFNEREWERREKLELANLFSVLFVCI